MKKKLIIIGISVAACIIMVGAFKIIGGGVTAETMAVNKGEIKQYVEDTAVVECKDKQTVYIEGAGKINGINLDAGDTVKKGDLLLTIDDADLQMQLKEANAKVDAARAQIQSTDISNYANQIEIAASAVAQAEVANNSALRNYESAKALYDGGAISKEDLNKAEDESKAAAATLKSSQLQLEEAKKGSPDYVKSGYVSQFEQAVIFRDTIQRNIEKQCIESPMDGVVLEKLVEENSIAAPGTAAFIIGNTSSLELEASIISDDSYKVSVGDEVEISGKFLGDTVIKGKVSKIAPSAKTITSTLGVNQKRVQVIIDITDDNNLLKPGYNVDIKIVTAAKDDVIAVPDSAVFDYAGSSCVFIVDNGKAVIRKVKKGIEGDKLIEITEGLNEGDMVLVKPDDTIKEGIKIKPSKHE